MREPANISSVTFVIIGRNEAANLPRTFESVLKVTENIVFVDSNSSDNSIEIAKKYGIARIIKVVSSNGTAALSRAKGAREVTTPFIHFLDGDETLEPGWLESALEKINSSELICGVHGYKKVYKENDSDFVILADQKDWEPDYLQGAFLIERQVYEEAGGMETRIFGEEERDLYVRVKALGKQIWYIHHLMAGHYDFKNKGLRHVLFGPSAYTIWLPLFKAIKNGHFSSYIFVYRRLLPFLFADLVSIIAVFWGAWGIAGAFLIQIAALAYCMRIERRGYFFTWKAAIINFPRIFKIFSVSQTSTVTRVV